MRPSFIPFWRSTMMEAESVLLTAGEQGSAGGRLLFTPDSILSITNAAQDVEYHEGRDYTVVAERRQVVRTRDSRVPLCPDGDLDGSTRAHTMLVTYTHHDAWWGHVPRRAIDRLSRT